MGSRLVVWAETPDEDGKEAEDTQAHGGVDETFAVRRLRRWLKGMFGGNPSPEDKPGPSSEDWPLRTDETARRPPRRDWFFLVRGCCRRSFIGVRPAAGRPVTRTGP